MVRSPRSGRLEPSGTIGAFILRDAATRLLRMRFGGSGAVKAARSRPNTGSRSRGMICPRLGLFLPKRGSRECRMRAAPAVSRAMGRRKRTRAYRFSGGNPAFPAQWLYGLYALFPATNSCCHGRQRIEICLSPVGPTRLRRLDISNGCQNHATSPYAAPSTATPIGEMPAEVLAKALKRRSSARRWITHGRTRPATTIAPDAAASTASNPASVTIAIRPSCRGGWAK
jgi:hypothetical protein